MKIIKRTKKEYPGFSLVEMILVVAISSIIALAVSQIFLSSIKSSEKNKEMQRDLEESRASMESMAKNIRMSKYTATASSGSILYMFNVSQGQCISYQFNNTDKVLKYAICSPDTDADGQPVANACQGANGCAGGASYSYSSLTQNNVTGQFYIPFATDRTNIPNRIGRATIRITTGTGTDSEKTLQTSVSFRDYQDILQ
jgi:prepilin-type N-terminal cleavage/methylation domain-containing protein